MEPFAQTQSKRTPLHWWLTAAAALVFFVWCFDLVPRTAPVQTGSITMSEDPADPDDLQAADWSDITAPTERLQSLSSDESADETPLAGQEEHWSDLKEPNDVPAEEQSIAAGQNAEDSMELTADEPAERQEGVLQDTGIERASWTTESAGKKKRRVVAEPTRGADQEVLPADFAQEFLDAKQHLADGQMLEAHAILSSLYWKYGEYREQLLENLQQTAEAIFLSPEEQFGEPHFVEYGQTLESIGRDYEVPWQYLSNLNRVTPEKLQAGQQLKVVRGPFGAVVDLSRYTLTVHAHGWYVRHYSIGIGRDEKTPVGKFTVREKLENPVWYDPDGGVVEADDPENPLGEYWIGLGNHIGIHGTIDPASIGAAASRGCIHLGDADIREVYELLGTDSTVMIRR